MHNEISPHLLQCVNYDITCNCTVIEQMYVSVYMSIIGFVQMNFFPGTVSILGSTITFSGVNL